MLLSADLLYVMTPRAGGMRYVAFDEAAVALSFIVAFVVAAIAIRAFDEAAGALVF